MAFFTSRAWRAFVGVAALGFCGASNAAPAVLGTDDARHLLNRTSFAASPAEIDAYSRLTREEAVSRLLASAQRTPVTPPPRWTTEPFYWARLARMTPEERQAAQRDRREKGIELRAWWLEEMRVTPYPLTEKMTLFWKKEHEPPRVASPAHYNVILPLRIPEVAPKHGQSSPLLTS